MTWRNLKDNHHIKMESNKNKVKFDHSSTTVIRLNRQSSYLLLIDFRWLNTGLFGMQFYFVHMNDFCICPGRRPDAPMRQSPFPISDIEQSFIEVYPEHIFPRLMLKMGFCYIAVF